VKKRKDAIQIRNSTAEFLMFTAQSGGQSIEVRYEEETIWLTQKLMATLFDVDVRTVSEHLRNIFTAEELNEEAVIRKFRNTADDGKSYLTQFYNLDAIISVGYRVNSEGSCRARLPVTSVTMYGGLVQRDTLDRKSNGNLIPEEHLLIRKGDIATLEGELAAVQKELAGHLKELGMGTA
jgi:hypothetical protein